MSDEWNGMAQIGPAGTQLSQGYMTNQEPGLNSAFAVVNQRPRQRESFPYRLHGNWILAFSILNCICGLMLMSVNIVNMVGLRVKEKFTAPTWSSAIVRMRMISYRTLIFMNIRFCCLR